MLWFLLVTPIEKCASNAQWVVRFAIMAEQVNFTIGTEFQSYNEFRDLLAKYESQEFCNFVVASSTPLKVGENITNRDVENFKYKYILYTCIMFGASRNKNPRNAKRQSKTFSSNCESQFSIGLKINNNGNVLRILRLADDHNHVRNENLYRAMPKQRRNTIDGAAPFLKQVANVKANKMLIQNALSVDNIPVKRKDVMNALAKHQKTPEDPNDMIAMVDAMKKIQGAVVKVFHN